MERLLLWGMRATGLAIVATAVQGIALAQEPRVPPSEVLAAYVARTDTSYQWRVQRRYEHPDAEVIELHLESQTWQGELWKHRLLVIRPKRVNDAGHAALIVGGGRWSNDYEAVSVEEELPEDGGIFVGIAQVLRSTLVVLGQVPYQPLFDLTEDRLIAYTFDRYLATGNPEWPLLLPMVKSAVRALDASSEFAEREWDEPLERFTVVGGSKRGWTTWLTATVDPRVTAIVPLVIDALNMQQHFPHHTEVWGAPSEAIKPYTDLNLPNVLGSAAGESLRQIVDPYSYRAELTLPKLIVLATNDEYFPLDSANLYWDELEGPKYLLYLPNEPHGVERLGPFILGLRALHAATGGRKPLPDLQWEYQWQDTQLTLCVDSQPRARNLRVWQALSADRDFRDATWNMAVETSRSKGRFELTQPASGYVAVFVDAGYGRLMRSFTLSTNLAVMGAADEPAFGTAPTGRAGVCAALAATPAKPIG